MPSRYIKNTILLAKLETTPGTFATPAPATDALLISDVSIEYGDQPISRDLIRPYFGASEQLVGTRSVTISFACEIAGSGAAGTAPAWGKLLRACGMAETVTASTYVMYNPISTGFEALSLAYAVDGVRHNIKGARGTVDLSMSVNTRPLLKFKFVGVESACSATAQPTGVVLTAWKAPQPISDVNTGDILLGCAYATGNVTGGTANPSAGIEISLGTDPQYVSLLGSSEVDIVGRETTGSVKFLPDAATEASLIASAKTLDTQTLGLKHGVTDGAGSRVWVFAPAVQIVSPKYEDIQGKIVLSCNLRFCPDAGNDELRIIVR